MITVKLPPDRVHPHVKANDIVAGTTFIGSCGYIVNALWFKLANNQVALLWNHGTNTVAGYYINADHTTLFTNVRYVDLSIEVKENDQR